ncbi:SIR2 family protein [Mucilaginibacter ximonensis]|uniref:SIR2 family protein n=1 Tax=Mucilaginibacter ximonensis TaxID=538021 RepID=A0ABW5YAT5_9SPHI
MTLKETFDNTVFLLGAGASYEANCLISKAMLGKLHQAIMDIPQDHIIYKDYKGAFIELYQFIRPSLSFQSDLRNIKSGSADNIYSPNIEDYILIIRKIINKDYIIPEPLVGSWSERLMRLEIQNPNIFEIYLNFIYEKVIEWITPKDEYKGAEELLLPLVDLLKETNDQDYHVNIFTLNYDLIFEKVFNRDSEFPVNTGFNSDGVWNDNAFNTPEAKINFSKIHGSLDWYLSEDDTYSLPDHEVAFNPLNPDERKPHIILGFEYKLFSVDPFFTLLQQFIQKLKTSKLLVVIGYSFFDNYLNNIIIRHLNKNEQGRLLIVDPYWSAKEKPEDEFLTYLKLIQADTSNLSMNNYTTLYSSRLQFYKNDNAEVSGAKSFYKDFFSNKCERLIQFLSEINKDDLEF